MKTNKRSLLCIIEIMHKHVQAGIRFPFRYQATEDRIFNRLISDISVVLRGNESISHSIETVSQAESEIMRVVSLSTTEKTEKTRI